MVIKNMKKLLYEEIIILAKRGSTVNPKSEYHKVL